MYFLAKILTYLKLDCQAVIDGRAIPDAVIEIDSYKTEFWRFQPPKPIFSLESGFLVLIIQT
jgi:hypothetical protein